MLVVLSHQLRPQVIPVPAKKPRPLKPKTGDDCVRCRNLVLPQSTRDNSRLAEWVANGVKLSRMMPELSNLPEGPAGFGLSLRRFWVGDELHLGRDRHLTGKSNSSSTFSM